MRNKLAIGIFITGILIISYPLTTKVYYNYNTETELTAINQNFQVKSEAQKNRYDSFQQYNQSIIDNNQEILNPPVEVLNRNDVSKPDFQTEDVIATVKIPILNIHYPVYDKATQENVDRGVSRVEGTSFPTGGENVNSVLAAHSHSPYYEWFTHIDKLENDDLIIINNFKETLYYRVVDMEVITPDQVEKLSIMEGRDMITLLTCTIDGAKRILVYAERSIKPIEVLAEEQPERTTSNIKYDGGWISDMKVLSESKWIILAVVLISALFIWSVKNNHLKG